MLAPACVLVGCWTNASCVALEGLISKALLTADVRPLCEAVMFFVPLAVILRSSNVARPEASVVRGVVPLREPVPVETVISTERPEVSTSLLYASWTWTVIAGEMANPAVVVDGCCIKTSFVAAPALTMTLLEVVDVSPDAVKLMVIVFATLWDRFRNVAVPFDAVAVSVP